MKAQDLPTLWGAPDNGRVTSKQFTFRLPVAVAAQIAALCDFYPGKTRTQIIGDLLAAALRDVEQALPTIDGRVVGTHPETGEDLHELQGPRREFRDLANKHFRELERELGAESPKDLY